MQTEALDLANLPLWLTRAQVCSLIGVCQSTLVTQFDPLLKPVKVGNWLRYHRDTILKFMRGELLPA